jgi:photosystem II stability/assembly factor-like uncharacterized protein
MRRFYILLIGLFVIDIANAQWVKQTINDDIHLKSVYFTDANTGYAVGDSCYFVGNVGHCEGIILKTNDGGTNWTIQVSGLDHVLVSVFFLDANTGFAVGDEGIFLKTTNGGTDWTTQTIDSTYALQTVFFTNPRTGYAVGGIDTGGTYYNTLIIKTVNGGVNWSQLSTGLTNKFVHSISFPMANTGFAVADSGIILKTADAGNSWNIQSFDCFYMFSVHFANENTGYAVGNKWVSQEQKYYGDIYKTTNGGISWSLQKSIMLSTSIGQFNSVFFIDEDTGCIVGNGRSIIKTVNGGDDWTEQPLGDLYYLNNVFFADDNTGYAVGDYGTIFKTTNGGFCEVKTGKEYFKIYPNPVSGQLTIETAQLKNENTLTISNISGQELIRQQLDNCKIQIDISNLTSGIYFVKLITDEKDITRKIIKE